MKKTVKLILASLGLILFLTACSNQSDTDTSNSSVESSSSNSMDSMEGMNHDGMVPATMKDAKNPKFPVGSNVILLDDHMEGMKGAEAQVVGAYDTIIYEVSYEPTTGGEMVKNHRWVVQEELKDSATEAGKGDSVVLNADHMDGMMGAEAQVDRAIKGTIYVVDYTPTDGQEKVKNHMWISEDEMKADTTKE
ncbi:YdhK family protein [Enterococcus casseliflavus]|uniref:YdhK family protein n=1 Tax=Enterococcus casseliflavus TaxID=37734 RepID=UPI00232CB5F8|nr:YdhK family protein [Enterococcus casseliflavus]MDB1688218.1 YdhK family protein [Enterococcus casseliflavus]